MKEVKAWEEKNKIQAQVEVQGVAKVQFGLKNGFISPNLL
jgi:hypothetical protein